MTHAWRPALLATFAVAPAAAEAHDRVLPDWLSVSGESRVRYEALDGQWRAGGTGGDQLLSLRTLVLIEADAGPAALGLELQDSRAFLDDASTPLSPAFVNPLDVLQLYVRLDAPRPPGARDSTLTLGRFTLNYGSRRIVERVDYGNVMAGFSGAYWRTRWPQGHELHVALTAPVVRAPADRGELGTNTPRADAAEYGKRFWGVHYRRARAVRGGWAEAFVYGQNEEDRPGEPSLNRRIVWPGVRLFREPAAGAWDWDVEATHRMGVRRATLAAGDGRDLDVAASSLHAGVGYTFAGPGRLRLRADLDYASGDADPADDRLDQYERPFGNRRTDLGVTGLHGPFAMANLIAPGVRAEGVIGTRADWRVTYKAGFLAEAADAWVAARVRDPAGRSGRFIGHALEPRARYWLAPDRLRLEAGLAWFWRGGFARTAPGTTREGDAAHVYAQITGTF